MHGRIVALTALLSTLALAAASAAAADQTLGLGQPSSVDGVVTSWRIQTAAPQAVRLRSTQAVVGGTATTATSDQVAVGASPAPQPVAARLPIAAGGTLQLLGATGSPTVDATVEPDADGDGYGDTTQDACAGDFTDHAAPCGGTATFGSPLTLAPDPRGFSGSGSPMQALQALAPDAARATAPLAPGVLTRWRARVDPTRGDTVLQVLRPAPGGGGGFDVVAETVPIHVTADAVVSLPATVVVKAGDRLAARSLANPGAGNADLGAVAFRDGDALGVHQPPATLGETFTAGSGTYADRRLLIQADVEPDADGDGKGDVTQGRADLRVTGAAPAVVDATAGWTHSYTLSNAGPDAALDVRLEIRPGFTLRAGDGPAGSTCENVEASMGVGIVCTLPKLAAGAAVSFGPGFIEPAIWPPFPGTRTSSVAVSALTPDPDTTNNAASLSTTVKPYAPNMPPGTFPAVPPCGHVVRGTRDDDVLRGTVFGDRLVGSDGGDLLKGNGGDDCLEGGAGNDVLDAGDGNDRLAGSSGRDRLAGGAGVDKFTGGAGNDRLGGGPGNDIISPGSGRDRVIAGGGSDTINSVDGVRESIDCGAGKDTVRADRRDRLKGCEKVTRRN